MTENSDTGGNVKYIGQPYWSQNAIHHYQSQNKGNVNRNFKDLKHDHSVPKTIIAKKSWLLLKLRIKLMLKKYMKY